MKYNLPLSRRTPFFENLYSEIDKYGGMFNAHLHLDRAGTFEDRYHQTLERDIYDASYISLQEKHKRIWDVHNGPAYEQEDLERRVNFYIDVMVELGTRRADTMVDVCSSSIGTRALDILTRIKEERSDDIDLRLAAYSPLGNKVEDPESWDLIERASAKADFIGLLPEADDLEDYPSHIGFYEHCRRGLLLAQRLNKEVHVHTDQRVLPGEDGTEQLVKAVREFGAPVSENGEPSIWAVHAISPTTYEEDRFQQLVIDLKETNIGIICCPSAALGMRQIRTCRTPTDNSMPRVLELLLGGVQVRVASDNIADMCSPSTSADLVDEIMILSAALRFYNAKILGKLAAGVAMDPEDLDHIREHLEQNKKEAAKFRRFF